MDAREQIRQFLSDVQRRLRSLNVLAAVCRASLGVAAVLLIALLLSRWVGGSVTALAVVALLSLAGAAVVLVWGLLPLRRRVSNRQLARYVEERVPAFDDRLVTAADCLDSEKEGVDGPLHGLMLRDAAASVARVDAGAVVAVDALRAAWFRAIASALALALVASFALGTARQAYDAAALVLFPSRLTLSVRPGNVTIKVGAQLSIEAQVVGTRAPLSVEVQIADGETWRSAAMRREAEDLHRLALEDVTTPFRYRVVAGNVTSPTYAVAVARPPRVTRIDLTYTYPRSLGLEPRSEADSGDIYAPAGTDVQISVATDRPVASGRLTMARGAPIDLQARGTETASARLTIEQDDSYRVALTGQDGLGNSGDTEYFIRILTDRPPEVHVSKPAGDRSVTRLQEVEIEAQADDDYGIDRLELVYSIRGGPEQAIPLDVPRHAASVTARHMLYLEDLDVQPGDFVSYYVRARDRARGSRANEARSDIFFLDIRPFEQQFSLAQSQSMAGAGYSGAIDELVNAQRQVVVATWKLDRRSREAQGARSEQDIRAVGRTEASLQERAERAASSFGESAMRDPRRRFEGSSSPPRPAAPEDEAMASAVQAMGRAVTALDELMVGGALPPEMEALNHLLRAQAAIKHHQVALNQSAAGAAGNGNRNFDVSTLFDEELRKQQQTSYETAKPPEARSQTGALDAIKELARRQDELLRRQQDLAAAPEEDRRRQLEQLTREQSELRQRAEDLAQQASSAAARGSASSSQPGALRGVADDMRQAAGDLRRGASAQAAASGTRARDRLRDLERNLETPGTNDRRRALGDLQLEARQLADRQRQVASDLDKAGKDGASVDVMRRLAGEEDRLTARARQLENRLKALAQGANTGRGGDPGADAASQAVRDFERERLSERMQDTADELRAGSGGRQATGPGTPAADARSRIQRQHDLAKALDRLADRLAGVSGAQDADTRRLSEKLAKTERLKEDLDRLGQALESASRAGRAGGEAGGKKAAGERGQTGEGRQGAGGTDLSRLEEESLRQLKEVQSLVSELQREDPSLSRNGVGFTLEGQGLVLSAPGTEAFKQDFAKWDALRRQAGVALEQAQSSLSKRLQTQTSKDRLPAGVADVAPPSYQNQVEQYFKALATNK
jgi:hypothetical protein